LIIVIIGWASYRFVHPIPPKTLVMSTGMEQGSFVLFGERYRQLLAQNGIRVKLLPSSGAVENLKRLQDQSQRVDASFVQDGLGKIEGLSNLVSLGSVFYTPLWVFYKGTETLDDLSQLRGKRINIGPEGSGIRKFALDLMKAADSLNPPTKINELPRAASKKAKMEGKIDVIMVSSASDNPFVQEMLHSVDLSVAARASGGFLFEYMEAVSPPR
jgi:TRAP-type uncharacterized transport system substrate-binding protein